MLLGQNYSILDDKKRMSLPAKFRIFFLNCDIIVSRGFDNCLVLRTVEQFEKWQEKILQQSEGIKETRILSRQIFANSEKLIIDAKGRINIPTSLLEIAQIKDKIVIIGMVNKLEIWSLENWEKFNKETQNKLDEVAYYLKDL